MAKDGCLGSPGACLQLLSQSLSMGLLLAFSEVLGVFGRGDPLSLYLCLGNGYFKSFDKQGCGREFIVWM